MITVSAVPGALTQEQSSARALAFRDAVVIRVRDNGAGMEPADCSRAFEPFFTTRGMASARGLGLSVVEGWARNAGGMARIESAIGQGTVVEIVLPRQRAEQGAGDAVQCPDGRGAS